MIYQFTLIDRLGSEFLIDDPIGWDDTTMVLERDDNKHGITFSYLAKDYKYIGSAGKKIMDEYNTYGLQGIMKLRIQYKCTPYDDLKLAFEGRMDFGTYDEVKGDECAVTIGIEDDSSEQILLNMSDQKVNLESLTSLNGVTLPAYSKLSANLLLQSKSIQVTNESNLAVDTNFDWKEGSYLPIGFPLIGGVAAPPACAIFIPGFDTIVSSEIGGYYHPIGSTPDAVIASADEWMYATMGKWSPSGPTYAGISITDPPPIGSVLLPYEPILGTAPPTPPTFHEKWHLRYFLPDNISPIINYDKSLGNVFGDLPMTNLTMRFKFKADYLTKIYPWGSSGSFSFRGIWSACTYCGIRDKDNKWTWLSTDAGTWSTHRGVYPLDPMTIIPNVTIDKDITVSGISLAPGDRLYLFTLVWYFKRIDDATYPTFNIKYYANNQFKLSGLSKLPSTNSKVFFINEALSRVVESISDNKIRVYSDYFGRTDSQPYTAASDGCGSLAVITNGLFIRRMEVKKPTTPPLFNQSLTDMWGGLNPIHNLGMDLEPDPSRPGYKRLRVERYDHFYEDDVVLSCYGVRNVNKKIKTSAHITTYKFGYGKWEAEEFSGIDEFLTKREFRTTLNQTRSTLDMTSSFIASGFALEVTRRKGNSTTEDYRYDNDTFIICIVRFFDQFLPEMGAYIIDTPTNIIDPNTIYNWRIRPLYNAMRWAPIIYASYKDFSSISEIKFSDGDGNFYASGKYLSGSNCKLSNTVLSEKQTILPTHFLETDYPTPKWELEDDTFDYPMNIDEFNILRASPRGLIYYENEETSGYGWIKKIEFKPDDGMASFTLKPKK